MNKVKEWVWTLGRFVVLSMLAFMVKGFVLIPFTDMTTAVERYSLTTGWYVYYAAFSSIFLFYAFAVFWMFKMQRFDPNKVAYLERTREQRENSEFSFKATYKATVQEVLHNDLLKYALFSAFPTVTCFYSWVQGVPPQVMAFSEHPFSSAAMFGYELFRVPHAFFDLFMPLGIFSVPLGLLLGLAFFVIAYSLVVTLYKKSLWESAEGRMPRRFGRGARTVAVLVLLALAIGWYGRMAGWFDKDPIVNKQPSAEVDTVVQVIDLGIPYSEQYPSLAEGDQSRIPWDMKLYDGKLYVGAGNYNDNTGPIGLRWYDTNSETWDGGSFIFEEQIPTFCVLDGILTIPGTDAVTGFGWDYSSYYQLRDGEWEQYRVLPDARHNFDIMRFGDDIFAAIGTDPGLSPLLVSHDDGQSFEHVPLTVGGNTVNTAPYIEVRSYFLFEHKGELYALITLIAQQSGSRRLVAQYDPQAKEFVVGSEFSDVTRLGTALGMRHTFFTEAVTWRGTAYFTNGKLIRFDGEKLVPTGALDESIVWDLLVREDALYLLTSTGEDTKTVTVYKTENGNEFEGVISFESDMYAVSFEMDDRYVYFGMADTLNPHSSDTGGICAVEYSTTK